MVAAGAAAFVTALDLSDVEVVDHRIQHANRVVLRNKIAQTGRKKQIVVLIVRFKDYLCHCLIVIDFVFRTYKIRIIYQKSNSYSFDIQKNSYLF